MIVISTGCAATPHIRIVYTCFTVGSFVLTCQIMVGTPVAVYPGLHTGIRGSYYSIGKDACVYISFEDAHPEILVYKHIVVTALLKCKEQFLYMHRNYWRRVKEKM